MKDLAFLTSPDMSKAEVVTNHIVIAEYAGISAGFWQMIWGLEKPCR